MENDYNEYDDYIKKLKLVHRANDLRNQNFIQEFLSQKNQEKRFKELEIQKRKRSIIVKSISIVFATIFLAVFSAIFVKDIIFPPNPPINKTNPVTIIKVYHIAALENIDFIGKNDKSISMAKNEYLEYNFYHSKGIEKILYKNDTTIFEPKYDNAIFNDLGYILKNTINNCLQDTNSIKELIFLGNLPITPAEIIRNERTQSLISKEQFIKLCKMKNLRIRFILKDKPTNTTNALMKKMNLYKINFEID